MDSLFISLVVKLSEPGNCSDTTHLNCTVRIAVAVGIKVSVFAGGMAEGWGDSHADKSRRRSEFRGWDEDFWHAFPSAIEGALMEMLIYLRGVIHLFAGALRVGGAWGLIWG